MKRILYLITALTTTVSVANAQIASVSEWVSGYSKITCNGSGSTISCNLDEWGDSDEDFSLVSTGNNTYSVKSTPDQEYLFENKKTAEYRLVDGHKVLLFKDAKGNITKAFQEMKGSWEHNTLRGILNIIGGEYVDEQGTKYTIAGNSFTTGGKTMTISIDPETYYLMTLDGKDTYFWTVSTTGINIYKCTIEEDGNATQDVIWHRLKNVSPDGRWSFLSTQVIDDNTLWRFDSKLIRIMRNEIYARKGYVFSSDDLKKYFGKQPWYKPINNNAAVKLSALETLNVEILKGNIAAREGTDDEEIEEGLQ